LSRDDLLLRSLSSIFEWNLRLDGVIAIIGVDQCVPFNHLLSNLCLATRYA
jgi:hypothetical protein